MYLILIFTALGIIGSIYVNYKHYDASLEEYISDAIPAAVIGAIMGFFVASGFSERTTEKHSSYFIESLQDGTTTNGNFFLGCGQIEGRMQYVFYYKTSDDLYNMGTLDYNKVQIKYTTGKPKINVTQRVPTDDFINNFAIDFTTYSKSYVIEVPKGTIKNNYNLDAQ